MEEAKCREIWMSFHGTYTSRSTTMNNKSKKIRDTSVMIDMAVDWEGNQFAQRIAQTFFPVDGDSTRSVQLYTGYLIDNQTLSISSDDGTTGSSRITNDTVTTELRKVTSDGSIQKTVETLCWVDFKNGKRARTQQHFYNDTLVGITIFDAEDCASRIPQIDASGKETGIGRKRLVPSAERSKHAHWAPTVPSDATVPTAPNVVRITVGSKRGRSISKKLRTVSDLASSGAINSQQKHLLKDLIIAEDREVAELLDEYNSGNPDPLLNMLSKDITASRSKKLWTDIDKDVSDSFNSLKVKASPAAPPSLPPPRPDTSMSSFELGSNLGDHRADRTLSDISLEALLATLDDGRLDDLVVESTAPGGFSISDPLIEISEGETPNSGMGDDLDVMEGVVEHGTDRIMSASSLDGWLDDLEPITAEASLYAKDYMHHPAIRPTLSAEPMTPFVLESSDITPSLALSSTEDTPDDSRRVKAEPVTIFVDSTSDSEAAGGAESEIFDKNSEAAMRSAGDVDYSSVRRYTPEERAEKIRLFKEKKARKVWDKKSVYESRQEHANRRVRVKGRFVSKEEEKLLSDTKKEVPASPYHPPGMFMPFGHMMPAYNLMWQQAARGAPAATDRRPSKGNLKPLAPALPSEAPFPPSAYPMASIPPPAMFMEYMRMWYTGAAASAAAHARPQVAPSIEGHSPAPASSSHNGMKP